MAVPARLVLLAMMTVGSVAANPAPSMRVSSWWGKVARPTGGSSATVAKDGVGTLQRRVARDGMGGSDSSEDTGMGMGGSDSSEDTGMGMGSSATAHANNELRKACRAKWVARKAASKGGSSKSPKENSSKSPKESSSKSPKESSSKSPKESSSKSPKESSSKSPKESSSKSPKESSSKSPKENSSKSPKTPKADKECEEFEAEFEAEAEAEADAGVTAAPENTDGSPTQGTSAAGDLVTPAAAAVVAGGGDGTTPVQGTGDGTTPGEDTGDGTTPVEGTGDGVAPVEGTNDGVAPGTGPIDIDLGGGGGGAAEAGGSVAAGTDPAQAAVIDALVAPSAPGGERIPVVEAPPTAEPTAQPTYPCDLQCNNGGVCTLVPEDCADPNAPKTKQVCDCNPNGIEQGSCGYGASCELRDACSDPSTSWCTQGPSTIPSGRSWSFDAAMCQSLPERLDYCGREQAVPGPAQATDGVVDIAGPGAAPVDDTQLRLAEEEQQKALQKAEQAQTAVAEEIASLEELKAELKGLEEKVQDDLAGGDDTAAAGGAAAEPSDPEVLEQAAKRAGEIRAKIAAATVAVEAKVAAADAATEDAEVATKALEREQVEFEVAVAASAGEEKAGAASASGDAAPKPGVTAGSIAAIVIAALLVVAVAVHRRAASGAGTGTAGGDTIKVSQITFGGADGSLTGTGDSLYLQPTPISYNQEVSYEELGGPGTVLHTATEGSAEALYAAGDAAELEVQYSVATPTGSGDRGGGKATGTGDVLYAFGSEMVDEAGEGAGWQDTGAAVYDIARPGSKRTADDINSFVATTLERPSKPYVSAEAFADPAESEAVYDLGAAPASVDVDQQEAMYTMATGTAQRQQPLYSVATGGAGDEDLYTLASQTGSSGDHVYSDPAPAPGADCVYDIASQDADLC